MCGDGGYAGGGGQSTLLGETPRKGKPLGPGQGLQRRLSALWMSSSHLCRLGNATFFMKQRHLLLPPLQGRAKVDVPRKQEAGGPTEGVSRTGRGNTSLAQGQEGVSPSGDSLALPLAFLGLQGLKLPPHQNPCDNRGLCFWQ